jgi:hypothetical protein
MKNKGYLIILCICLFTSCQSDDDGMEAPQAQPTIFQGEVLYADNSEPVSNAKIGIIGFESFLFGGDVPIETLEGILDKSAQGEFNLTFKADPDIDYFFIGVTFYDQANPGLIIGGSDFANGMVCSPVDCRSFEPGKEYTGLTIVVPRPETN